MTAYPCARCSETYQIDSNRRTTLYCRPCRALNRADRQTVRNARRSQAREDVESLVEEYVREGMSTDYAALMQHRFDLADESEPYPDDWQVVGTDYLKQANTSAGPDEGATAWFTDVRVQLDQRATAAMLDPWWQQHPNWHIGMHEAGPPPRPALATSPSPGRDESIGDAA